MTVSNYDAVTGNIFLTSSRGFSRRNVIKPDLAAPGTNLVCPAPSNKYTQITGTCAAAAHSIGIIAMLLEWAVVKGNYTSITGSNIHKLLIRGAYTYKNIEYPNTIWGYGLIDIYGVFEKLI